MIIVKVFWNTNTKGEPIDNVGLEFDEMPQSWYGPFESFDSGATWLNNALFDDMDVFEITLDEVDDPKTEGRCLNDPQEYPDGYKRIDSQELQAP